MKTKKPEELEVGDKLFCLYHADDDKYTAVQTWVIVRIRRSRYGNANLYITRIDPPIGGDLDAFGPTKLDVNSTRVNGEEAHCAFRAFFTTKTGAIRHVVRVAKNNTRTARHRLQEAEREEATTLRLIAKMQAAAKNNQTGGVRRP